MEGRRDVQGERAEKHNEEDQAADEEGASVQGDVCGNVRGLSNNKNKSYFETSQSASAGSHGLLNTITLPNQPPKGLPAASSQGKRASRSATISTRGRGGTGPTHGASLPTVRGQRRFLAHDSLTTITIVYACASTSEAKALLLLSAATRT